jgi:hypothetical protein
LKADNSYIQTSKLLGNQKPPQLVEVERRIWQSIFRIAENQMDITSEMCDFCAWITSREDYLMGDEAKTWFKLPEVSTAAVHMSLTCADVVGPLPLGWAIPDLVQHQNQNLVEDENEHSGQTQTPTQDRGDDDMDQEQGGDEGGRRDEVMSEAQGRDEGSRRDEVMSEVQGGDEGGTRDQIMDEARGGEEGDWRESDGEYEGEDDMDEDDEDIQSPSNPLADAINRAQVANLQSSNEGVRREPEENEEDDEHMEPEENSPEDSITAEHSHLRKSLRQKSMVQHSSISTANSFLKSMASARHRPTASKKNKKTKEAIYPVSIADGAGSAVEHAIDVDVLFV